MDAARKRADEGYVEDVARAVAAMLRRRPVVSATALVAGIAGIAVTMGDWLWLDPSLFRAWVTSAAFLAGAALGAPRPIARRAWTTRRWAVMVVWGVAVTALALFWTADRGHGVPESIKLFVFLVFAFLLGFGLRNPIADACAAGLAAATVFPAAISTEVGGPFPHRSGDPALYAGWLAVFAMLFVARRGRWTLALPIAIGLILWHESVAWDFWSLRNLTTKDQVGFAEIFLVAAASVLMPVIAGRAAAALSRNESGDAPARLVVRIQRDPWRTALVAVLVGTAFFRAIGTPSPECMFVVVGGMACLAHCAVGTSFAALAPWTAAAALSVPLSVAFQEPLWPHSVKLTVLPEALVVLYVPLVLGALVARRRTRGWPWWGWAAVAWAWTLMLLHEAQVVSPSYWHGGESLARDATSCVVISLLVHAVATSAVPARIVLAASPVVSFLVMEAFHCVWMRALGQGGLRWSSLLPALVAGPAAALLALAARRVRSMTAVPEDHASFELAAARTGSLVPAPNP
jgi:hypothetical protein